MSDRDGRIWFGAGIDNSQLQRDARQSTRILNSIGDTAEAEGARIDNMARKVAAGVGIAFGLREASQFVSKMAQIRGQFQQLEVAFETMLGSKEKADALMAQMIETAATTPFSLESVSQGAKQLLAYGTAAEDVQETITRLGDIAAGLSIPLNDLVYLYGTTMVQGRLFTQDMRQFMGRGIPLVEELAKQFGVAKEEISEMVTAGRVGAEEVQKAIWAMTNEGGKFGGLMEKQSKTITGQISNLEDAVNVMFNEMGRSQEGAINAVISTGAFLVEHYETVGKIIAGLVITYGAYKAALITLAAVQKIQQAMALQRALAISAETGATIALTNAEAFAAVVKARLTAVQLALNKAVMANPYVMAAVAIAAVVAALILFKDRTTAAEKAQNELNETLKESAEAKERLVTKTDQLIAKMRDEATTAIGLRKAYEELKKTAPDAFNDLSLEQFKNLSDKEIKIRVNTYIDEQEYKTLNAELQKTLNEIEQLKIENFTSTSGRNENSWAVTRMAEKAEVAQAKVDILKTKLRQLEEIREQAKIDNLPEEERLAYYENQLSLLQQQRTSIVNLQNSTKDLNTAWGQFGLQSWTNLAGIDALDNKISIITGHIQGLKPTEVATGGGNKSYWENIKKKAQEERDALTESQIGGEVWKKLSATIAEAEKKLLAWSPAKIKAKTADEIAKAAQKIADLELQEVNNSKKAAIEKEQAELDNQKKLAETKEDGFAKETELIELKHKQDLLDIKKRAQELLEAQQDAERLAWEKSGSKGLFKPSTSLKDTSELDQSTHTATIVYKADTEKLVKSLEQSYQTFDEKRRDINLKFNQEEAVLVKNDPGNTERIKVLERERKKALDRLRDELLEENGLLDLFNGDGSDFITKKIKEALPLFEDISKLSFKELEKVDEVINGIELSPQLIASLNLTKEEAEKLKQALEKVKKASSETTDLEKWEDILDITRKLSSSLIDLGGALELSGGALGEIGSVISGLAGSIDNISTSFSKTATKGDIINAGISGMVDLYSMVAEQINKNKEAEEAWNAAITESAHKLSMARIEAEAYKETNIFSSTENPYAKAIAGAKQYQTAILELNKNASALGGGQVQTGTEKVVSASNIAKGVGAGAAIGAAVGSFVPVVGNLVGGLIGGVIGGVVGAFTTQTVPIFKSLKEKYGELFNQDTFELNPEILADYDKLDEATKKQIDNWEEIREKALEARQEVEDTFKELAGDIGTNLSNTLIEAFRNGELYDAIDDFHDYMTSVIEDIVAKLVFSVTMQPYLDRLARGLNDSFGFPTNGIDADPSKLDFSIVDDLLDFAKIYKEGLEAYERGIRDAQEALGFEGLDIFGSSRTAKKSGIATASQESVDENNGRLTAIQGHTYSILQYVKAIADKDGVGVPELETASIRENTYSISNSVNELVGLTNRALQHLNGIETNTRVLSEIASNTKSTKGSIDEIRNKLKNFERI